MEYFSQPLLRGDSQWSVYFHSTAWILIGLLFLRLWCFRSLWITLFQFAPLVGLPVTLFTVLYGANKDLKESVLGSKTAVKLFKVFGLVLFLVHIFNIYLVLSSPTFSLKFLTSISSASRLSTCLFLLCDGLSLSTSLGIFILAEQGIFYLAKFLILAILIGPGSAFLLMAIEREERLVKELKLAHSSEMKKKQ